MPESSRPVERTAGDDREHPILVVAEHVITGALVESMVEVAGLTPVTPAPGEPIADAVARVHPDLVLLDLEHAAADDDALYRDATAAGARFVLFSSGGDRRALAREGKRRGVSICQLPLPHREFTALLSRLVTERRGGAQ